MAVKRMSPMRKSTSTEARVVPGISLTSTRGSCASWLTSVLLPALRRPTKAIFTGASLGVSGSPACAGSSSVSFSVRVSRPRRCSTLVRTMFL